MFASTEHGKRIIINKDSRVTIGVCVTRSGVVMDKHAPEGHTVNTGVECIHAGQESMDAVALFQGSYLCLDVVCR